MKFLFLRVYSAESSLPVLGGYARSHWRPAGDVQTGKRAMIAINRRAILVPSGTT